MSEGAPAGFWRRYAAWSLDWLLLGTPLALLLAPWLARAIAQANAVNALLQDWVYQRVVDAGGAFPSPLAMALELLGDRAFAAAMHAGVLAFEATLARVLGVLLAVGAVYFIGFEASRWQATPGKRLARVQVQALDGGAPGATRAAARHVAGALSWLSCNLGHAIAGWRGDRRALHDLIAGTRLRAYGPLPGWARGWLGLQLSLLLSLLLGTLAWLAWLLWQIATL